MPLRTDDLHLTRLSAQGALLAPVVTAGPLGIQPPAALSPQAASEIYASLSRYGFTGFQIIPGGAQIATADGRCMLILTGAGWQFTEDLMGTTFEHSVDKLDVAIRDFATKLPEGTSLGPQVIAVEGTWDNLPESATAYITQRFFSDQASAVIRNLVAGQELAGVGFRAIVTRPSAHPLPPGVASASPGPVLEAFDIKIETLLADPQKLFVAAVGTYSPTATFDVVGRHASEVREVLWSRLASNLTFGS